MHLRNSRLDKIFSLPLSTQAFSQLSTLQASLQNRNMDPDMTDTWNYLWGSFFSSSRSYKQIRGTVEASPLFRWLWGSSNPWKHEFFFWLLLRDRLNTINMLRREKKEFWKITTVYSAIVTVKKLSSISSSAAPSVRHAGAPCISVGVLILTPLIWLLKQEDCLAIPSSENWWSQPSGLYGRLEMPSSLTMETATFQAGKECSRKSSIWFVLEPNLTREANFWHGETITPKAFPSFCSWA